MATFDFKTTVEYADAMCEHKRMVDFREHSKHIKVGDTIQYTPWYKGRAVKGHAIEGKKWGVIYVDDADPRVMKDFDMLCLVEIVPEWE